MVDAARRRAASLVDRRADLERAARAVPRAPSFAGALRGPAVAVIAEVKRRSPSAGLLRAELDAGTRAQEYVRGGAAAISVLTDPDFFGGTLLDLTAVATAVAVPVLRKDFIVQELQLVEARAAGASAVLLIARVLGAHGLDRLTRGARALGLETLVEVHSADECDAALAVRPDVVGVNSRDLDTLQVDPEAAARLLGAVPPEVTTVAESGIRLRGDVERAADAGADAVLVGTALSSAADGADAVRALTGVPRQRRTARV